MIIKVNNGTLNNDPIYQEFIKDNPGQGTLKVRATSASEALPIKDVNIIVSKQIGNDTYIFFEGKTDFNNSSFYYYLPSFNQEKKKIVGEKIIKFKGVNIYYKLN